MRNHIDLFFIAIFVGCALTLALTSESIRYAIQIGEDEHHEVTKAFLWARGYRLYSDVWNDQPPVHTVLLGLIFRWSGPGIAKARALACAFGVLFFGTFFFLVRIISGPKIAYVALIALFTAPVVFRLSISAMLEVPAFAFGLLSSVLAIHAMQSINMKRSILLLGSGSIMAIALQTKLTSVLLIPAIVLQVISKGLTNPSDSKIKSSVTHLALWSFSALIVFLAIGGLLGVRYDAAWKSHFSSNPQSPEAKSLCLSLNVFESHPEGVAALILCAILCYLRRSWSLLKFPYVLLITTALIHCLHRPWWPYYYLHFAIPIAWLIGHSVCSQVPTSVQIHSHWGALTQAVSANATSLVMFCLMAYYGGRRLLAEVGQLQNLPQIQDNSIIREMKHFAFETKWTYSEDNIYSFHAGLLSIPELAVMPKKRFWASEISQREIVRILDRYNPQQVLIGYSYHDEGFKHFLRTKYVQLYEEGGERLFVSKQLLANLNTY